MINKTLALFLLASCLGCKRINDSGTTSPAAIIHKVNQENNLIAGMSINDIKGFQWMNEPEAVQFDNGSLKIKVSAKTDFFNNPEDGAVGATAPLLYREATGNFVATTLLKPDFSDVWNAGALMVHIDSLHWIKFAFENSDATGKSIVTVVTRGVSDDANGAVLNDADSVWLRIIRKGNNYAMHWSLDGQDFKMARLCQMPQAEVVKIGLEVQCPAGKGANHEVLYFYLEEKTVEDLRKGI